MIKPFGQNILIEPVIKTQILVAEKASLCEYGKVISVGPDVKVIKPGDTVGYLVWGISALEIDGKNYYFVPENTDFLLCQIEND